MPLAPNRGPSSVSNRKGIQHKRSKSELYSLISDRSVRVYMSQVCQGNGTSSSEQHLICRTINSSFLAGVPRIYAWDEKKSIKKCVTLLLSKNEKKKPVKILQIFFIYVMCILSHLIQYAYSIKKKFQWISHNDEEITITLAVYTDSPS